MKNATFIIDDWLAAEGIHDPDRRWNGWAVPFFTLEEVQKIAETVNASIDPNDTWEKITVQDGKVFSEYNGGDESEIEEVASIDFEGKKYFGVGATSWVWDVWEEEGK